jgi:ketosteroid isomerase-like protein
VVGSYSADPRWPLKLTPISSIGKSRPATLAVRQSLASSANEFNRDEMSMSTGSNLAIVRASYEAYVRKDRAALERVIAADFHFSSPLDNHLDRSTYFERCWPNSAYIEAFEFVRLVQQDDQVIATYDARTVDGKRFRNTEVLTLRDGQISEVEVYFGWNLPHPAPQGGFINPSE